MFDSKIYIKRRELLRKQVSTGLILFLGHEDSPMNYPANAYHFRQDSSFLYFFGLDTPALAAVIDVDGNKEVLFGDDIDIEDIIWMGYLPTLKDRAAEVGVKQTAALNELPGLLREATEKGRPVHYLPPYRPETFLKIAKLLGIKPDEAKAKSSPTLVRAVISLRSIKSNEEIAELETALKTTYKMYATAMHMAQPGIYEKDIAGRIDGFAIAGGGSTAFPTILTKNGQILHNHGHENLLKKGDLLVVDAGAESPLHYAADITRTIPVGGKFSAKQKDVYEIVLRAQEMAIKSIKPGVKYREIHLQTARVIASGLKDIDLMKGDIEEAVLQGAHALFFPHGLGHMLGLDVHDMENLGENFVGYDDTVQRSKQFGLAYLRMAKEVKPGHVLTVEPGIYFIPALIDKWKKENKFTDFVAYDKLEAYRNFGGIRIEDDVLVTKDGRKVLGRPIPKKPAKVEEAVKI
ncbi:MAG: aminopeptidase P family protein [Candidatus Aminicenantales bacterium]